MRESGVVSAHVDSHYSFIGNGRKSAILQFWSKIQVHSQQIGKISRASVWVLHNLSEEKHPKIICLIKIKNLIKIYLFEFNVEQVRKLYSIRSYFFYLSPLYYFCKTVVSQQAR